MSNKESKTYIANIPETERKRIVIAGGGFGGLKLLRKLLGKSYQVVMIDKNNFHQFQPLLYQVATAGLEPSAISFPIRKIIQKENNVHFRIARLLKIDAEEKEVETDIGYLKYDILVLAIGANTNFFGQKDIEKYTLPMKSAADSIFIRNILLKNMEKALQQTDPIKISEYTSMVLVGGGPTGVELSGAVAEMKKYIFPKDYPELDLSHMRIILYEASDRLLGGMSEYAGQHAKEYLERLGVEVKLNTRVKDYDEAKLSLSDGSKVLSKTVVWAAGVRANPVNGLSEEIFAHAKRIKVDRFNKVVGYDDIYALGDLAYMETPKYPKGHPQVAQTAIQQAQKLYENLPAILNGKGEPKPFEYKDKGSLATVGRNLAVADLPIFHFKGFVAWLLWSFVHLMTIVGVKNKLLIFMDWTWNYLTYDHSLRLLIRHRSSEDKE